MRFICVDVLFWNGSKDDECFVCMYVCCLTPERDYYRATSAVTEGLGDCGLIRKNAPLQLPLRQTRGSEEDLTVPRYPHRTDEMNYENIICSKLIMSLFNKIQLR